MNRLIITFALYFMTSALTNAASQNVIMQKSVTVSMVGVENKTTDIYVGIAPNSYNCLYSGIYFFKKGQSEVLSVALEAKRAGKTVRVDFVQNSSDLMCIGQSIFVE